MPGRKCYLQVLLVLLQHCMLGTAADPAEEAVQGVQAVAVDLVGIDLVVEDRLGYHLEDHQDLDQPEQLRV